MRVCGTTGLVNIHSPLCHVRESPSLYCSEAAVADNSQRSRCAYQVSGGDGTTEKRSCLPFAGIRTFVLIFFFFPWNVCLCSNPPHLLAVSHGRVPGLGLPEGNGVVLVNDVLTHLLFTNEKIPARTGHFITVRLPRPKTFKQSVSSAVVNKTVPLKENLCFIFMVFFFNKILGGSCLLIRVGTE